MQKPKIPSDEASRLRALHSLDILDTPSEERFDRVTRLARRLFRVPIALVSLVDSDRQWFKSCQGLDASETARSISFCGHAILGEEVLVVEDASQDERFHDNPLVLDDPRIRFYAGMPLRSRDGHGLGTLCIIDREPRRLEAEDLGLLADLAAMVERELGAYELATSDELTGLLNRRGFELLAPQLLALGESSQKAVTLLYLDLDGFKQVNDEHGHEEGDRALAAFAGIMQGVFRQSDLLARLGGDEFCLLMLGADPETARVPLGALASHVALHNQRPDASYPLRYSVGIAAYDPAEHGGLGELMREADSRMYDAKRERQTAPE